MEQVGANVRISLLQRSPTGVAAGGGGQLAGDDAGVVGVDVAALVGVVGRAGHRVGVVRVFTGSDAGHLLIGESIGDNGGCA